MKHISCEWKCKIGGRKCNSIQKWNNDKCCCECINTKEQHVCEKDYIWNTATCNCENSKCLASIIDDSVITCNEIIEKTKTKYYSTKTLRTKTVPAKINEKKANL